jgi:hypothetical protein
MPTWLRIMAFASSTMLKDSTSSEIVVPAIVLIKISNCEPDSNSPKNQTPRDTAASNTVRGRRGMGSALSVTIHMDICEVSRHARFKRRLTNQLGIKKIAAGCLGGPKCTCMCHTAPGPCGIRRVCVAIRNRDFERTLIWVHAQSLKRRMTAIRRKS